MSFHIPSIYPETQIAPLHRDIFLPFSSHKVAVAQPASVGVATVWPSLPSSLGAQCQSRAEEEDTSVGQRAVMSERIQEGWVDGDSEEQDPACTPRPAGRQGKRKSILEPDCTELFVEINFFHYETEDERSKLCVVSVSWGSIPSRLPVIETKSLCFWHRVSTTTWCNRQQSVAPLITVAIV